MKANKIRHNARRMPFAIAGIVIASAVLVGLFLAYEKLRELWLEQCIVRDMEQQVSIRSGKMVKAEVIAESFGIRPGANLALIDYQEKRDKTLATIPNLRNLHVKRHLPDRVIIDIEERTPIARLGLRGQKKDIGKVVDAEGIVFRYFRNTQLLPIIREGSAPGTAIGKRVSTRARAALEFISLCQYPEFHEIGVLDVDISSPDYLVATINTGTNYAKLKLAWEGMDNPTPASNAALKRRLTHLKQAIATRVGSNALIWNATEPERIYADTKGKL